MVITRSLRWALPLTAFVGLLTAADLLVAEEDQPADKQPAAKTPEQIFADLDKNGDGKLAAGEVPQGQQRMFERLLRAAGKEKGSELTKDEFLSAFKPDDLRVAAPQNLGGGRGGNGFDPAQIFQRLDRNRDGKLTLDEVPEQNVGIRQIFTRLNKTELTREELIQAARRGEFGPRGPMADPEAFFKRFDSNQDGKLTLSEIPEPFKPQMERWLSAVGKGKDDGISADELKKLVAENQPREGGRPGNNPATQRPGDGRGFGVLIFRKLDANGDGRLSKEELSKAADLFEELDRNHDGQLEPAELFGAPPEGARPGAPGRPGGRPEAQREPESKDSK